MESIIKKSIVLILIVSIFACQVDSNCNTLNVDYVTFNTVSLNANAEEINVQVIFDSIVSPQTDSVFFLEDTLQNFQLPLSPVENQTDFFFYYGPFIDTIRFTYEKRNTVDSPECGIDMQYFGMDTAFQTFDSLIIVNDTLKSTLNAPNIKLFIF
ncbi:hypothetical protein SAMN05661096_02845 [Marivirga sericea]|uniref:Uncharacterized protein n=1 Tax=Marivirga sericea TaxID=1028 RepID=A0A1X7KLF2_9BACT|nr:DUF6452 family protein [Marivirga sericea]SMG41964.1 hypothetical protein SAMN05661096_02845 [Marivirga sericea]